MRLYLGLAILLLSSCAFKDNEVDMIIHNARIYSVDGAFTISEAMAVDSGKVVAVGAEREILNKYNAKMALDAGQGVIYPGFIDAHSHFIGYAAGELEVDLTGTKSWNDCIKRIQDYAQANPEGWITGRGWDQNDWDIKTFPTKDTLDQLFPSRPISVNRVDGHAALVNTEALRHAKISVGDRVTGGEIVKGENGSMTGLLIDNAMVKVEAVIPDPNGPRLMAAIASAQEKCFEKGLTTVCDAGIDTSEVNLLRKMHSSGDLKMKVYAMLSADDAGMEFMKRGRVDDERLTVRSIKLFADGALGSRGAALKRDYHDHHGHKGALLHQPVYFKQWAALCDLYGFQLNTHCIGDRANQIILAIYSEQLEGQNDKRWRVEHAQVVNSDDFAKFEKNNILPSVQPTHAISDMAWAEDRLGSDRLPGAYAYQTLLDQNGIILLGTDFPIEDIDPLHTFHAAVFRKNADGSPIGGWMPDEALSREEALMGMTIWAAIGNFEEDRKGSLEKGKAADFVIMDRDIMTCEEGDVLKAKVMATFINGEKVY